MSCFFSPSAVVEGRKTGERRPNSDILSSLFEETHSSSISLAERSGAATDAHAHSISVYYFPTSQQWELQCAYVHRDKLLLIARREKRTVLNVYHAMSSLQLGEHQVPTFSDRLFLQQEISSGSEPPSKVLGASIECSPVLSLVCCQSSWGKVASSTVLLTPVTDVFFRQLFGFELSLARSTVVLIGSQTGTVSYIDIHGYCMPCSFSETGGLTNTLCCLDQPVVSIHALWLPTSTDTQTCVEGGLSTTANTLVVVGRLGRLVLFIEAEAEKEAPVYTEFAVPGPILSSLLVKSHSIVFSTLKGIYRVCLEPECILKSLNPDTDSGSCAVVPRLQLRFPVSVSSTFILGNCFQPMNGVCSMRAISSDGRLFTVDVKSCKNAEQEVEGLEVTKECMTSIENSSKQAVSVSAKLQKVNSSIVELNKALSVLLSMQSSDTQCQPFSCTIRPVTERVGALLYAEVELCSGDSLGSLGRGWSILVTTQCVGSTRSVFSTLALTGLMSNDTIRHRMKLELEPGMPLTFVVTASISYAGTHLQPILTQQHRLTDAAQFQATGVSFVVATRVLDALDFIQPHGTPSIQSSSPHIDPPEVQHGCSFEILLPWGTDSTHSESKPPAERKREALQILFPHFVSDAALANSNGSVVFQAQNYYGSTVTFKVTDREGKLCLSISTDCRSHMVEIISCVNHRVCGRNRSATKSIQVCPWMNFERLGARVTIGRLQVLHHCTCICCLGVVQRSG